MCDTIVKRNIHETEIPKYVYKVVQRVGDGKYVTPVMGEPLQKGTWKEAKKHEQPKHSSDPLIYHLSTKFRKKDRVVNSSKWSENHVGKWGSFENERSAIYADLISNFTDDHGWKFPTMVVKCQIRAEVDSSTYNNLPTFLSTYIKVVEELYRRGD